MEYKDKVESVGIQYLHDKLLEEAGELQEAILKLARRDFTSLDVIEEWLDVVALVEAVLISQLTSTSKRRFIKEVLFVGTKNWMEKNKARGRARLDLTIAYLHKLVSQIDKHGNHLKQTFSPEARRTMRENNVG